MAAKLIKRMFLYSAGLTFTNMARLFMRLFTGVMFMQFGIRQIALNFTLRTRIMTGRHCRSP